MRTLRQVLLSLTCLSLALVATSAAQQQGTAPASYCRPCYRNGGVPDGPRPSWGAAPYGWPPYGRVIPYGGVAPYGVAPYAGVAPYGTTPYGGAAPYAGPSAADTGITGAAPTTPGAAPDVFGPGGGAAAGGPAAAPNMLGDSIGTGSASTIIVQPPEALSPGIMDGATGAFRYLGSPQLNPYSIAPSAPPLQFSFPSATFQFGQTVPAFTAIADTNYFYGSDNSIPPDGYNGTFSISTEPSTQLRNAVVNINTALESAALQSNQRVVSVDATYTGGEVVEVNPLVPLPPWPDLRPERQQVEPPNFAFPSTFDARFWYDVSSTIGTLPPAIIIPIPRGAPGANVGRLKIAEDTSPIPRDRVLFDYDFFAGAQVFRGGVDVSRFTPGFEKTLFNGLMSLEMKVPMAITVDNHIVADGHTDIAAEELGNMAFTFKALVSTVPVLSLGVRVSAPTADDLRVVLADGTPMVKIENESVYVAPFFGWLIDLSDRCYFQGFLQWDIDTCGSPVYTNDQSGSGLAQRGVFTDTTLMYYDVGLGYWLHRTNDPTYAFTGLAVTGEMHWTRSLQDPDVVSYQNLFVVGDTLDEIDVLNMTLGAHVLCANNTTVTLGYSFPLDEESIRAFDGEVRLMVNYYFGAPNQAPFTF